MSKQFASPERSLTVSPEQSLIASPERSLIASPERSMTANFAHVYGDHVDTDVIIPARYLSAADEAHLAKHCMIDIDPDFAKRVKSGDLIIAGKNFGCGSSREHAPLAIKASGIRCVIAKSFARIFLRNAVNIGLTIIEANTDALKASTGDVIKINWELGVIVNKTSAVQIPFSAPPAFIHNIVKAGGLLPYVTAEQEALKRHGA